MVTFINIFYASWKISIQVFICNFISYIFQGKNHLNIKAHLLTSFSTAIFNYFPIMTNFIFMVYHVSSKQNESCLLLCKIVFTSWLILGCNSTTPLNISLLWKTFNWCKHWPKSKFLFQNKLNFYLKHCTHICISKSWAFKTFATFFSHKITLFHMYLLECF